MKNQTINDWLCSATSTLETEIELGYGTDKEKYQNAKKAMRKAIKDLKRASKMCEKVYDFNFDNIF